jgi:hypothetical protein
MEEQIVINDDTEEQMKDEQIINREQSTDNPLRILRHVTQGRMKTFYSFVTLVYYGATHQERELYQRFLSSMIYTNAENKNQVEQELKRDGLWFEETNISSCMEQLKQIRYNQELNVVKNTIRITRDNLHWEGPNSRQKRILINLYELSKQEEIQLDQFQTLWNNLEQVLPSLEEFVQLYKLSPNDERLNYLWTATICSPLYSVDIVQDFIDSHDWENWNPVATMFDALKIGLVLSQFKHSLSAIKSHGGPPFDNYRGAYTNDSTYRIMHDGEEVTIEQAMKRNGDLLVRQRFIALFALVKKYPRLMLLDTKFLFMLCPFLQNNLAKIDATAWQVNIIPELKRITNK